MSTFSSTSSASQSPKSTLNSSESSNEGSFDKKIHSIPPEHREWYLNQAALLSSAHNADPKTQRILKAQVLQAYSKVSSYCESEIQSHNIPTSPLLPENCGYHRCTTNPLTTHVDSLIAAKMGLEPWEARLICSPLIKEVFARTYPCPDFDVKLETVGAYQEILDRLFDDLRLGLVPKSIVVLDFSKLLTVNSSKSTRKVIEQLEDLFVEKLVAFLDEKPGSESRNLAQTLITQVQVIATQSIEKKNDPVQHVLITPNFLVDPASSYDPRVNELIDDPAVMKPHSRFLNEVISIMSRTGYRPSPQSVRQAWLSLENFAQILGKHDLQQAPLFADRKAVPVVFSSFQDFLKHPLMLRFKDLGKQPKAAPYLKVMPKATFKLLRGLERCTRKEGGVDSLFAERGLDGLLQLSYFRLLEAISTCIHKQNDMVVFNNHLEVIHQEIQNFLAILTPHSKGALESTMLKGLRKAKGGVLPAELPDCKIHLKPSAMHSFASVLAAAESQKGNNHLAVLLLNDSYYCEMGTLKTAKTYDLSVLNAEKFGNVSLDQAFDVPPQSSIDVFVTELHHNILHDRQAYQAEPVLDQILQLVESGRLSDQATVIIDNTVDTAESQEVKELLAHPVIQEQVKQGRLNLVLLRSAQKFDMLGMDNYYGGITSSINNELAFPAFNERMDHAQDQLTGLSYQGLTHLHKYARVDLDHFRKTLMSNTLKLYADLPEAAIYSKDSSNPMQISQINDDKLFYLDIKFPNYPLAQAAFRKRLVKFARQNQLPFSVRASFGFLMTNLTMIGPDKTRLSVGMENEKTLKHYAAFFYRTQALIESVMEEAEKYQPPIQTMDQILASRL